MPGTAAGGSAARVLMAAPLHGAAAGAALALVETALVLSAGSYVAAPIVLAVLAFWTAAGAAFAAAAAVLLAPVAILVKGRGRSAIVPAAVVAAAAACGALSIRAGITKGLPRGADVLLDARFIAAWAAAMGVGAWSLCARRSWRPAHATAAAVAAIAFSMTAAWFGPRAASAWALFAGPPVFACVVGAAVERARGAAKSLAAGGAVVLASASVVAAMLVFGARPEAPIDEGYSGGAAAAAMLAGKPNVIIITLDTTRGDHMSLCGYKYPTTPNLERFAGDCRFFPNARSVSSWTLPAHASMLTGKYPREHGARAATEGGSESLERNILSGVPLAASQVTLATYLSLKGYDTAAIVANYSWLCRQFGVNQGFRFYQDTPRYMNFRRGGSPAYSIAAAAADKALGANGKFLESTWSARDITRLADRWLDRRADGPFFLMLNYMDPHAPYAPPPPFDRLHENVPVNRRVARQQPWQEFYDSYNAGLVAMDDALARQVVNQYDGEIAYMDHWIGALIDRLKARGLYDDCLIIVAPDHGEHLGEKGLLNHGVSLYDGAVLAPVLVKYPLGKHAGERVVAAVSLVDVFATVFDVLGLPCPQTSSRPLGSPPAPFYAEEYRKASIIMRSGKRFDRDLTAVYDGGLKLILSSTGRRELYDTAADPGEDHNLILDRPEAAMRLKRDLDGWRARTPLFDGRGEAANTIPPETLERMRSLGYLGR